MLTYFFIIFKVIQDLHRTNRCSFKIMSINLSTSYLEHSSSDALQLCLSLFPSMSRELVFLHLAHQVLLKVSCLQRRWGWARRRRTGRGHRRSVTSFIAVKSAGIGSKSNPLQLFIPSTFGKFDFDFSRPIHLPLPSIDYIAGCSSSSISRECVYAALCACAVGSKPGKEVCPPTTQVLAPSTKIDQTLTFQGICFATRCYSGARVLRKPSADD